MKTMADGMDATSLQSAPHDALHHALLDCVRRPRATLIRIWSWKTAAMSALLRSLIFWVTNRNLGEAVALRAMAVEAVFAIFASGLLGAVTQRLRDARPLWATALTVWLGMPLTMLVAQAAVHECFHTPHQEVGAHLLVCLRGGGFRVHLVCHAARRSAAGRRR